MIKVYKRSKTDRRSYSPDRPWMAGPVPEDKRESCYPTWEEAMAWATMSTEDRQAFLDQEAREEGGW